MVDFPLLRFAHKNTKQNANEADGVVHNFRCKLTNFKAPRAPCSTKTRGMLHLTVIWNTSESFAYHTSFGRFEMIVYFPGRFRFLRFKNAATWTNAQRHAISRDVIWLPALSRSGRHVFALLCRADCALLCRVCGRGSTTALSHIY